MGRSVNEKKERIARMGIVKLSAKGGCSFTFVYHNMLSAAVAAAALHPQTFIHH